MVEMEDKLIKVLKFWVLKFFRSNIPHCFEQPSSLEGFLFHTSGKNFVCTET
jgi:hypothetical protein